MDERTELNEISRLLGGRDTGPGQVLGTVRRTLDFLRGCLRLRGDDDPLVMMQWMLEAGDLPLAPGAVEAARETQDQWHRLVLGEHDDRCDCEECLAARGEHAP